MKNPMIKLSVQQKITREGENIMNTDKIYAEAISQTLVDAPLVPAYLKHQQRLYLMTWKKNF